MTPKPLFLSLFLLLASCAAVVAGTPVLAYDEQTGKNEYRPVLVPATQGLAEKRVTYLTLRDGESGLTETLTTTKGHPFYLAKNVDGTNRPVPEGHEDLGMPWVGAGELKPGDKVRQADGTTGSVTRVQSTLETRRMYNLDVAVADTFHVGQGQWLVHNAGYNGPVKISPAGFQDVITKGVHVSVNGVELRVLPAAGGEIVFKPVFSGYSESEVRRAVIVAREEIQSSAALRTKLYEAAVAASRNLATETGALAELARGRSAETAFLAKALQKMGICE